MYGLSLVLLTGALLHCSDASTREYYVAIEEIEWDYAPSGRNLMKNISLDDDEDASVFTSNGETTIGRVYKKAVFRQYTDASFDQKTPRPEHWGLIGPPLKVEVGDKLIVHVKNTARRHYSMHPHGVFYNKTHEGALYHDKRSNDLKLGDSIAPGGSFTYHWDVFDSFGPAADDPNCLTWGYHSHIKSHKDTNSGLVGPLIVCRPGTLDEMGNRNDIDEEFYFLFTVLDENESWYLHENIQRYCTDPDSVDTDDEDFQETNKMHGINGLMYGNLRGVSACKGDRIAVYLFGVGTEVDLHSVHFHGQTIITHGHRQDTVNVFPGVFTTSLLNADNPGIFDISCSVNEHISAGMVAKFPVSQCGQEEEDYQTQEAEKGLTGNVRQFFIGIHEENWNYAPNGDDSVIYLGANKDGSHYGTFFAQEPDRIGGIYKKAIFHKYRSGDFEVVKPKPESFGILGPLIAVEVGDTVRVTLKNFANNQTYNIEPHGVFYNDLTNVGPREIHTYKWSVPDSVAPSDIDSDCISYIYTSSVDPVKDTNSGLVGPILVCKRGTLEINLDRRARYILLTVFDENSSHYTEENVQQFTDEPESVDIEDEDFVESNLMHSINGLSYGNLEMNLCRYAETDIHVMAIGTEVDMHAFYIGNIFYTFRNEYTNVLSVFPHTTASVTVKPAELGVTDMICGVYDHLLGGMRTSVSIIDCGIEPEERQSGPKGVTRIYCIAAVDEIWDYSPWKEEILDNDLSAFTKREKGRFIGSKYLKAVYHEYTDGTFRVRKKKPQHLGLLGPIIKAEEGDTIEVVFKNMARREYSIVPQGMEIEGFFTDGLASAAPNETVTYIWKIPSEAVPAANQPACNARIYSSDVDRVADVYTGLVGPLYICRKGSLSEDGRTHGVDAEFFLFFLVFDESSSHYIDENIEKFVEVDPSTFDKEDADFLENNLMHGINGRLGYLEGLEMYDGDHVVWHLVGAGNEVDIHTVHFHAHAYNYTSDYSTHSDVFSLFPGKTGTVEMDMNAVGRWLLHCHVNDHIVGGMTTTYTVLPKSEKTMQHIACYGEQRWKHVKKHNRKHNLQCVFESPGDFYNLLEGAAGNSIEVCTTSVRTDAAFSCQNTVSLSPLKIAMMNISTTFSVEPEALHDLMSTFTQLRVLHANNIGLRFLHPNTFSQNRRLNKILLRRNLLRHVPPGIFRNATLLRVVDLRGNNNLELEDGVLPLETIEGQKLRVRLD